MCDVQIHNMYVYSNSTDNANIILFADNNGQLFQNSHKFYEPNSICRGIIDTIHMKINYDHVLILSFGFVSNANDSNLLNTAKHFFKIKIIRIYNITRNFPTV